MTVFAKVSPELDFPAEERQTLRLWKSSSIFEKTLSKPAPNGPFVFYEGPPTANGLPHNGHVLTRVIKDLFPRYKTMRGYSVARKAGWDTHGLPVEVEVEKQLGIHGKAAIERYGVEPFIRRCLDSVFRYTKEWEALTERVAFWVDMRDAYVTYYKSYVESVWWALSELYKKGLLYQSHKVVWWWAQGGTALSAGEVGQGYRAVDDPSVYVAFPVVEGDGVCLLVWTTTPWTLSSNMYAAVHPDRDYSVVRTADGRRFIVASAIVASLQGKIGALATERTMTGRELVGTAYRPPFDLFRSEAEGLSAIVWRVIPENFVTLDTGTGIVHVAPAFGEDDYEAHRRVQRERGSPVPLFCAVEPDGTFIGRAGPYAGRWVKDCDKEIVRDLRDRGILVHAETIRHDYPFCWRADSDPLIQYARPAWYIRTTAQIEKAIENSRSVHWLPEHIKEGRFGDFLAHNVDWALSRERWWGTPLNVWVCDSNPEHKVVPSCVAEIEQRNPRAFEHFHAARRADPSLSEHLIVHKPWIDAVTFSCACCSGTMRRVPEVIDCWFDSGCMPFAQWGYPHRGRAEFDRSYPADFISEAIDQTRGWFYSLLMISTLVFEKPTPRPYGTCLVLGHVCDKDGKKESKKSGNYTPPEVILDKVAMEFAVEAAPAESKRNRGGACVETGELALMSREDYEGMDLLEGSDGALVRLYRADCPERAVSLRVATDARVRRRAIALSESVRAKLGLEVCQTRDVRPVDVPWLPTSQKVTLEDPSTSAPGADAFRWFFYASSPPWSTTRHSLSNVRALQKEFAVKLRNVYSFFTIYANIDAFRPGGRPAVEAGQRPELDRWILSELAMTTRDVTARMDEYDVFGATGLLVAFVDSLSNWWVRRSRSRFWQSEWTIDKQSAHETLYACLVDLSKLTAPFTPYAAEAMYQNLVVGAGVPGACESVHLEQWPEAHGAAIDQRLSHKTSVVRSLVSLGLRARMDAKIKVRQPLRTVTLVLNDQRDIELVSDAFDELREELNVLSVKLGAESDRRAFGKTSYKPNFRSLGARGLGKVAQELKRAWASEDAAAEHEVARRALLEGKAMRGDLELLRDDVEMTFEPTAGFSVAADRVGSVFLDTKLDEELRELGLVRELLNRIQTMRKDLGLEYTDRIRVWIDGSPRVVRVVDIHRNTVAAEALALEVHGVCAVDSGRSTAERAAPQDETGHGFLERNVDVEDESVRIRVARAEPQSA
ncbi:MAG: isoleucine--tRNA ligase [Polyangiaceae bacterium]|jgi:isoleucyl-tRNA synthetase